MQIVQTTIDLKLSYDCSFLVCVTVGLGDNEQEWKYQDDGKVVFNSYHTMEVSQLTLGPMCS